MAQPEPIRSPAEAWLVLNGLPHLGPVTLRHLRDRFGDDPLSVLRASSAELQSVPGVGPRIAGALREWERHFDLPRERERLEKHGARFVALDDPEYPPVLREIYDPPIGLYAQGPSVFREPAVAIVGSRKTTLYGQRIARDLAARLARRGVTIVSGLARGIDAVAHEGALGEGGTTVAVLGNGLDRVYPPENLELFRQLREKGTIYSEFPFGFRANRQTFPMRNRVVSGLSRGVVVVESDVDGGSMITARFAGEQGRQVFAVPGRIDQRSSAGCHQLIRDGATLVTSADDIAEELRLGELPLPGFPGKEGGNAGAAGAGTGETADPRADWTEDERAVHAVLAEGAVLHPDAIGHQTGLPASQVSATLLLLELRRRVRKHADGSFEAV